MTTVTTEPRRDEERVSMGSNSDDLNLERNGINMKVLLKDGSSKEYAEPMAIIDIAKDISEGLARVACVAELEIGRAHV